ncbi:MAG: glutamate--tRNA ligase [Pirellulaceae bacterium]|jgi:glutamyl-tRNA synthetase|nr:glutamate--tRNA ligase [Pirellulaceae bacterium]
MVRTRFAPSPTGYLHIGGVRTALFNWLYARKHGGQFVLRIDDTDHDRNVAEALQPILDGFRWLGLDWDEGPDVDGPYAPYYQSQRADRHAEVVAQLLESGAAYRDYTRPEEMKQWRDAAEKEKRSFVYDRRFAATTDEQARQFEDEGRTATVKLRMPREGSCEFTDSIRGAVSFEWANEADHVIQRADGSCLYNLATVVDDHDFAITHVLRGIEHLPNTPRQLFIFQSLGWEPPQFGHIPYVAEPSGTAKLSKRKIEKYAKNREFKKLHDHGVAIANRIGLEIDDENFNPVLTRFYEEVGFTPDAIVNYLVLLGWSLDDKTEEFTRAEMIQHFSLERVNKAPASFDPQKLTAFQQRYFDRLADKEKTPKTLRMLQAAQLVSTPPDCDVGPYLAKITAAAGDRLTVAGDILNFDDFFLADDQLSYDEKAFEKRLRKPPEAVDLLAKFRAVLADLETFEAADLETALKAFVETEEIKIGQVIHALRVATTGKGVGFGMFETLELLGRDRCLNRIDLAAKRLDS